MSAPPTSRRLDGAQLGNGLALLGILVLVVVLTRWQVDPLHWRMPPSGRAWIAAAVAATWLGFTGLLAMGRRSRRRRNGAMLHAARDLDAGADWLVVHASQTGHAEEVASRTVQSLQPSGQSVRALPIGQLDPEHLRQARRALFIVSTTGEGDAPDGAAAFVRRTMQAAAGLETLHYGVLALGDREYDAYCAFGHRLDAWLRQSHAHPLFDLIEVDNGDPGALRLWQQHLGQLGGRTDAPDWSAPRYQRWRLSHRRHLNPGSPGGPAFLVVLRPEDPAHLAWTAGDIAEVGPRNADDTLDAWLEATGVDGGATVRLGEAKMPFRDALARSRLPAIDVPAASGDPQAIAARLEALPHREYSIASTPGEGELCLLVRQVVHADGRLGSGSGWLTRHAGQDAPVDLRIRRNSAFHPPADDRPLVLIGNGTGLAGLRATLQARIERGHHRNWLLFGERTRAHDQHFGEDLSAWQASGKLQHLDRVFSRDGDPQKYVQDALRTHAGRLSRWVSDGASIHVCGSLEGMAPGVDAVLRETLGNDEVDAMVEAGRYRRDIY